MPILNWLSREDDIRAASRVPYRLLEEVPELSAGDPNTGNMIIQGDNLEALKSLLPFYAGQVKCIYIDPPYNTGSAFEHYDDALEHSKWLSMVWPRLELLREFLRDDGSIWVSMDDDEAHYLKIILDEVFGRRNFVATCIWQKRFSRDGRKAIGDAHENIFCYAANPATMHLANAENAHTDSGRDRPEITPAMIEAGVKAFAGWLEQQDYGAETLGARDCVCRVLSASLANIPQSN